ncbi:MAG: hypothetical protein HYY16_17940 [Planctomycetes bacterium]|nr:hypothetical protein [Planctomycetota bacterium]
MGRTRLSPVSKAKPMRSAVLKGTRGGFAGVTGLATSLGPVTQSGSGRAQKGRRGNSGNAVYG